jgi:uncharacterized protein (DUF111 family)
MTAGEKQTDKELVEVRTTLHRSEFAWLRQIAKKKGMPVEDVARLALRVFMEDDAVSEMGEE